MKRVHKFNFRKNTLNKKFGFPLTMTEEEMAKNSVHIKYGTADYLNIFGKVVESI